MSVVIPCYNQARYLGEAVESVLAQTSPALEVVVVDDGSTDDTAEVAARYPGVRCVRQRNQGLAGARNTGLRASRGEYLVFLDADDRLLPGALEAGLRHMAAHPDCAFVSGYYRLIRADGTPFDGKPPPPAPEDAYLELLRVNYIGMHATVMFRREAIEAVGGYDASLAACEDYDLYLRIARRSPVCSHEAVVAEYRQHDANMSRDAALMLRTSLTVLRLQWRHVKGNRPYEEALRGGIAAWREYFGDRLVREVRARARAGEWRPAARGMLALLRYHPREFARQAGRKARATATRVPRRILAKLAH